MVKPLSSGFDVQPYRRKYLEDYGRRMSMDNTTQLWDDHVASVLEEQGFEIEESPRSVYKVEKLYEALGKYSPENYPLIDMSNDYIKEGINFAYACFGKPSDEPFLSALEFTPKVVRSITSNPRASAGLTAWGQTKAEAFYRAYERGLQQINGEKKPEPCVAFKRTQFNDKTRLVWGYPYAMTAIEALFARPLIEKFKQGNTPMAFGMNTGVLGAKLRVSSYSRDYAYSVDVSSFDSSANGKLIHTAFQILRTWFNLGLKEPTTGKGYDEIFDLIEHYFIHTPIVMPNLNVYKGKKHGVPSGSYFTQIVDSIINVIYAGAISARFSLHVRKSDVNVLGDDLIMWSNRDISLDAISRFASGLFKVKFNAEKSSKFRHNETIHYLGRDWENGVPTLNIQDILIRMTQPETFRKYAKDPEVRDKQVLLLLMSYAAVYKDAYPILVKVLSKYRRWYTTQTNLEEFILGLDRQELDPNFMSGLSRYTKIYMPDEHECLGEINPLALQFWK